MSDNEKYTLIGLGIILTIAGIVIFVKKLGNEGTNKIKLAGVEFELSAPSLVIFVVGVALTISPYLLAPLYISPPEQDKEPVIIGNGSNGNGGDHPKHRLPLTEFSLPGISKILETADNYQIVLVSDLKGLRTFDILRANSIEKKGIVIEFRYQGVTKLTLSEYDGENSIVYGSYLTTVSFIGTQEVSVELELSVDGTALGSWSNLGVSGKFAIEKK